MSPLRWLPLWLLATLAGCSGFFGNEPSGESPLRAAQLVLEGVPGTLVAGTCSGPVLIKSQTSDGQAAVLSGTVDNTIRVNGTRLEVFRDGNCGVAGDPTLRAGKSEAGFSFRQGRAGTTLIYAASAMLTTPMVTFSVIAGSPSQLRIAGPGEVEAQRCYPFEIVVEDQAGNRTPSSSTFTVTPTGVGAGAMYSDPACSNSGGIQIATGSESSLFFYKNPTVGDGPSLGASAPHWESVPLPLIVTKNGNSYLAQPGALSGSTYHLCAVVNGDVRCWGYNNAGQLGDGTGTSRNVPTLVKNLPTGALAVDAGLTHSCALVAGSIWCWGSNTYGELGNGTTTPSVSPVKVLGISQATSFTIAQYGACAVVDGGVKCWGCGAHGNLGNGTTPYAQPTPVDVTGLGPGSGVRSVVDTGYYGTACAIIEDGSVKCWGKNAYGTLGNGSFTPDVSSVPVVVTGLPAGFGVSALGIGGSRSGGTACVLVQGSVRCWGLGSVGQIGDGANVTRTSATLVPGLTDVTQLSVGGDNGTTCALKNGIPQCWGDNSNANGLTGAWSPAKFSMPNPSVFNAITEVFVAGRQTCYFKQNYLQCAGFGNVGELGNGVSANSANPVSVSNVDSVLGNIAAGRSHACAVVDGAIRCWGANASGQLGNGTNDPASLPDNVTGIPAAAVQVATGDDHTCAIAAGGALCWGANASGQLGNQSQVLARSPGQVSGLASGVRKVACGSQHSCAIVNGALKCWGGNQRGQLGIGNNLTKLSPEPVPLPGEVTDVAAGGDQTCAVVNGGAWCWGASGTTPMAVSGLSTGVTQVAVGSAHACAVQSGKLRCWGANASGQLGNNSVVDSLIPVDTGLVAITAVSTGGDHTCAVSAGTARCWGLNSSGQLGDGSRTSASSGVNTSLSGVLSISAGDAFSCALSQGRFYCWGENDRGQLGLGVSQDLPTPALLSLP